MSSRRISAERLRGVAALAERAAAALETAGLVEVDLILSDLGNEQLIEIDAVPALHPSGMIARIAHSVGLPFDGIVDEVLAGAHLHTRTRGRAAHPERRTCDTAFSGLEGRSSQQEPH
jgi:D-alanine-D-alanine ligase-like ATP-grasp enzyme